MTNERNRLYEGMFIINSNLSEEARNKALERVAKLIEDRNGEILKTHDMGKKRLAYEINKKREGFYYLLYFNFSSKLLLEITKELHLNEDLIRFAIFKAENVLESLEFKSLIDQN